MDKKEFHRISDVIEGCIGEMEKDRVESMLLMFEALAEAYAKRKGGAIMIQLVENGVMLSSVNVDEYTAADVLGAVAVKLNSDLINDTPPREMFN